MIPTPTHRMIVALLLAGCHRGEAAEEAEAPSGPAHVRCVPVTAGAFRETRVLRGSVQLPPERLARVAAQVPGRVLRLMVREGDTVAAGAVLAEIEASPFVDESTVARGELSTARLEATTADGTVARLTGLVARGVAAQQELDDARVRAAQAHANLATRTGTAAQVRRSLARTRLVAPLAGVVMRVLRGAGELVDGTPNTPVVEVGDPAAVAFAANGVADDLVLVQHGQSASLTLATSDAPAWEAHVDRVSFAVDPLTGIGTVWVRPDAPRAMPVGLTGVARVAVAERSDVITVPESALRERDGDHAEVVLCEEHKAKAHEVTLGAASDGRVEVREGLSAGQRIVADHAAGLEDDAALQEQP